MIIGIIHKTYYKFKVQERGGGYFVSRRFLDSRRREKRSERKLYNIIMCRDTVKITASRTVKPVIAKLCTIRK